MAPKVGILTWHDPTNCGSALQAYALHYYLHQNGIDARIIRYVPQWCRGDYMQMPWRMLSLKQIIKRLFKECLLLFYTIIPYSLQKKVSPFFPFYNQHCTMTEPCTEENIEEICRSFTTIISGSDQIWNPNHIDPIFLQNFQTHPLNKISYAASLGGKTMPEELIPLYKESLKSFSAISVRENDGRELINQLGYSAAIHIDPTLLIDASHYRAIAKPALYIKKPFAFCYFLSTDQEYKMQVQEYVKKHHLEAIGFSADHEDYIWMKKVDIMSPLEWLWLIDNAEVVLTNSYHATILSLILHTPFFTFLRFDARSKKSQNARLEQLNSYFEISDYLVDTKIPDLPVYPFSKFEERLPNLRQKANEYLMKNIE